MKLKLSASEADEIVSLIDGVLNAHAHTPDMTRRQGRLQLIRDRIKGVAR